MFRSQTNAREFSRHVAELPPEFSVHKVHDVWIVVGPSGIFVVGRDEGEIEHATELTAARAHELRELLGEIDPWVPFVDAIVVADHEESGRACAVIEPSMLTMALTVGGQSLDEATLTRLRLHLPTATAQLDPGRPRPLDPA